MTNFGDFWGPRDKVSTKGRSAFGGKNQNLKFKIKDSGTILLVKIKPIFSIVGNFFRRLGRIYNVLNRVDKIALGILLIILLGLAGYKFDRDWLSKTKRVPTTGGTYKEVLIGQAQYLNPVLANSDADRTMNQLIYSGLTKIDSAGNIAPDLAKSWEISADSKTYTFHLRSDVSWQDGVAFSSADVAATISAIKDDNIKSPYFDAWKDVVTSTPNPNTVTFTLKSPYGPFLYNTSIGIIPAHIDSSAISSSPVGTGPYQFTKAISGNNKLISEVDLARYNSYYGQKPYISEVNFQIVENETKAKDNLNNFFSPAQAVAGLSIKDDAVSYSFATSRDFGMIFNLNTDKFKDAAVRKKIAGVDKFDPQISFKLLVLDKPLSVQTAGDLQKNYASRGINISIDKKGAVEYTNLLTKRNYEAVLYGFDSGYDRDPYPFWHSSQIASGNNFSGFSNKQADLLLESARMTTDIVTRNQKYDQFFAILADQVPAIYLPAQNFSFSVKPSVMGITVIKGFEPWDHLNDFANWYLKTKRVKP